MDFSCPPAPFKKREYIADIGKILIQDYGKKQYYKPKEVKKAHKKSPWNGGLDFSCWAMSTYSSHSEFDRHHEATGEACDYREMKAEILEGIALPDVIQHHDFTDTNLDASWLDLGEALDGILTGIGEFFSSISDS